MIFEIFVFLIFTYLLLCSFRYLIFLIFKLKYGNVKIILGKTLFSFKQIKIQNDTLFAEIDNLKMKINLMTLIGFSSCPLISFYIEKIDFNIFKIHRKKRNHHIFAYESWIFRHISTLILYVVIKKLDINVKNITIRYKKLSFSIDNIVQVYKRKNVEINDEFLLNNLIFSLDKNTIFKIPQIKLSLFFVFQMI